MKGGYLMTVRKIRAEERVAASMIQTVAFNGSQDFTAALADPSTHTEGYEQVWASFEGDRMTAVIEVIPYTMLFDGHRVKMAGIAGVASLPEHRQGGAVRAIFAESMKAMRAEGQIFSYLYPFSHPFYRKFGYELGYVCNNVIFTTKDFKKHKLGGNLKHFQKGDDIAPFFHIHEEFAKNFNLAVIRDEASFKKSIDKDSYATKQYTYLWLNDAGEPKSYLRFEPGRHDNETSMDVRRFEWLDREGLLGMLSMLDKHFNNYPYVKWEIPPTLSPDSLINEPWDVESKLKACGMNRVVDVERALPLLKAPEGSGRVTIAVTDDFLDWNNGTYAVEWSGGVLKAVRVEAALDVTVSVQILSQLMTGFLTPAMAQEAGAITIEKNAEALGRLFPVKPVYILERF